MKILDRIIADVKEYKRICSLKFEFEDILDCLKLYSEEHHFYRLEQFKFLDKGYEAKMYAPRGLLLTEIDKVIPQIEENMCCKFQRSEVRRDGKGKYVYVKFISNN